MTRKFDEKEWVPAMRTYTDGTPPRLDVYMSPIHQEGWYTSNWIEDNPSYGGGYGWHISTILRGRLIPQVSLTRLLYGRDQ